MPKAQRVEVTMIFGDDNQPDKIIWGNGSVTWYQLVEMDLAATNEYLGAENVRQPLHESQSTYTG